MLNKSQTKRVGIILLLLQLSGGAFASPLFKGIMNSVDQMVNGVHDRGGYGHRPLAFSEDEARETMRGIAEDLRERTSPERFEMLKKIVKAERPHRYCPDVIKAYLADLYLYSQVTAYAPANDSRWDLFVSFLAPNISIGSNVANVNTVGIPGALATLYGIGTLYQNISAIIVAPTNFFEENDVVSTFVKTQRDLVSGAYMNLKFYHRLGTVLTGTENVCNVTSINEYANALNTFKSLPSLYGWSAFWMCVVMVQLCNTTTYGNHIPSFGPYNNATGVGAAGKCWYFWKDAPQVLQDDGPGGAGYLLTSTHSLLCFSSTLAVLHNNPEYAAGVCSSFGEQTSGTGCWPSS